MNAVRDKIRVLSGGKDGSKRPPPKGGGGGRFDPGDWRSRLVRDREQNVRGVPHNLLLILENDPLFDALFWLDEFGNRIMLSRPPPWRGGVQYEFTDTDAVEIAAWLGDPEHYTMSVKTDLILACVEAIARRNKRHSVREYLQGLRWDGVKRLERLMPEFFGTIDNDYNRGVGPCWLVSAVSRVLWVDPILPYQASKVDFMIVLEGVQSAGKTTSVLELFGANQYAEATESPTHKDFFQCLRGCWGVEIGEMSSFRKADKEKIKQVITIRSDLYRASYARTARRHRRECVFVGTINKSDWNSDDTGARRFLPVEVGKVDLARIVAERDQLWAEAVVLFHDGFAFWELPSDARREQDKRYNEDVWTSRVIRWLEGQSKANLYDQLPADRIERRRTIVDDKEITVDRVRECSIAEILTFAIGMDAPRQNHADAGRVGTIMTRLKWFHYRPSYLGGRVRCYQRPEALE
jgi:predicted P-loop ATPase